MAIYHLSVKPVQRSKGRTATASAAYRAGVCLKDERTGEVYDYTRKQGVEHTELIFPSGVNMNREELWNAAEASEIRKDGTPAREYEIALPAELTADERQELAHEFGNMVVQKYGAAVDIAIHAPNRNGDQRNFHVHILATTRCFVNGALSQKTDFDLSDRDRKKKGLGTRRAELESIRADWARMVNRALEKAQLQERVTYKSHAERGLGVEPTHHLGPTATAMERRGIQTERGDLNSNASSQVLDTVSEEKELISLERQQQGVSAVRLLFSQEQTTRAAAKAEAEKKERQRQAYRAELERRYGQAVCKLIYPQSLSTALTLPEYGRYLDRLQAATPEQRVEMMKELRHAEQRYEARELFYAVAILVSRDTSISGRERVRDTMLKDWDRATPKLRQQMELEAREYVRTHNRQNQRGMSLGR